jgi:hypothetical protein
MFEKIDLDGSGEIDFNEFMSVIYEAHIGSRAPIDNNSAKSVSDNRLVQRTTTSSFEAQQKFEFFTDQVVAKANEDHGRAIFTAFLLLTFLFLIGTSTVVFNYFKCRVFVDNVYGNSRYLYRDYSVDCDSTRYISYLPWAILMILVYPIGIPLLYFCLLWKHRETLRDPVALEREELLGYPKVGHLHFLVESYAPKYYYFEVIECVRRLSLASAIGLASPNSVLSPTLGILISLCFIYVFIKFEPFQKKEDSDLSVMLIYSLTLLFLAALLIKVDETSSDEGDDKLFGIILIIIMVAGPVVIFLKFVSDHLFPSTSSSSSSLNDEVEDDSKEEFLKNKNDDDGAILSSSVDNNSTNQTELEMTEQTTMSKPPQQTGLKI